MTKLDILREKNALQNKIDCINKVDICQSKPLRLYIDITNHCNYSCVLCPHSKKSQVVQKGFMSEATYKKIIDYFGCTAQRLSLHNWGEPLLHPNISDYVEYAVNKGLEVKFSTNLACLTEELACRLIVSGLQGITVSIHAGTAKTYKKYTQRDTFNVVLKNLKMLIKQKKIFKACTPHITWLYVVNAYNYNEIEIARALASDIGVDSFVTIPTRTMMDEEVLLTKEEKIQKYGEWIPKTLEWNKYLDIANRSSNNSCTWPWERLVFDWDGSIYPCCLVYGDKYKYKFDIENNDIDKLWNSTNMVEFRKASQGKSNQTICSICYKNNFCDFV